MRKPPRRMTLCHLEVLVMPNGEISCGGESLGWFKRFGRYLTRKDQSPAVIRLRRRLRAITPAAVAVPTPVNKKP